MDELLENELDKVKLKYSDSDIEEVLNKIITNQQYLFIKDLIIDELKNQYISKIELGYEVID